MFLVDASPNPASLGMVIICHEGINLQPQLVLTGLIKTSTALTIDFDFSLGLRKLPNLGRWVGT